MAQFEAAEIGARIRQARKERGLSQDELAAMASFSKRSLQDYETGVTIPYRHLRELSRLLNKPEEWFLYGDGESEEGGQLTDERVREIFNEELADVRAQLRAVLAQLELRAAGGDPGAEEEQTG